LILGFWQLTEGQFFFKSSHNEGATKVSLITINKFEKYCALVEEIEATGGDVSEKTADELIECKRQIASSVDSTVRYRKYLKDSIDQYKAAIKHFVGIQERKLERLDAFLTNTISFSGDLKTPFSSIKIQSKKTKSIFILDFDIVMNEYPECVTISTFDNVRTIRLMKDDLIQLAKNKTPKGYSVIEKETNFIMTRQKIGEKDNDTSEN
jgi:hypothetical protein